MSLNIIACINKKRGIGKDGMIPWFNPQDQKGNAGSLYLATLSDLKYFKSITNGKIVVMGRKTWDSIYKKFPDGLPGRVNVVLSGNRDIIVSERVNVIHHIAILDEFIKNRKKEGKDVFIIGGSSLYDYYIQKCDKLYINEINNNIKCDVFFPLIPQMYKY